MCLVLCILFGARGCHSVHSESETTAKQTGRCKKIYVLPEQLVRTVQAIMKIADSFCRNCFVRLVLNLPECETKLAHTHADTGFWSHLAWIPLFWLIPTEIFD